MSIGSSRIFTAQLAPSGTAETASQPQRRKTATAGSSAPHLEQVLHHGLAVGVVGAGEVGGVALLRKSVGAGQAVSAWSLSAKTAVEAELLLPLHHIPPFPHRLLSRCCCCRMMHPQQPLATPLPRTWKPTPLPCLNLPSS